MRMWRPGRRTGAGLPSCPTGLPTRICTRIRVDLLVISADGGEPRQDRIRRSAEKISSASRRMGAGLLIMAVEGEGMDYKNNSLWVVPADGSAAARNLTENDDLHIAAWTINDIGQPETMPPTWSLDGRRIYFPHCCAWQLGAEVHRSAMAGTCTRSFPKLWRPAGSVVGGFSTSAEIRVRWHTVYGDAG